jgi:hypothetical protein
MRQFRLLFFAALLCGSLLKAEAQQPVPPREDTQFWNETQVILPVNDRVSLIFLGVLRLGRNIHRPTDERAGASVSFRLNDYLGVQLTYQYIE